jgi:hypothetical protein
MLLFLVTFLVAWCFVGIRALPWWSDGGLWLKYANALAGATWPMWSEKPLNYPPLFPSMLALLLYLTKDPVFSIKFLAVVVFSLRPVAAYFSSIIIFRKRLVAIVTAIIIMLLPIHVEMFGWGGYPNILGLSLLMISMALLISWLRGTIGRLLPALFITSALIVLDHNLTFLVYSMSLLMLLLSLFLLKKIAAALKVLSVFSLTLGVYFLYTFAFLWPPQYLLYNEAAYHHLIVTLSSGFLTWMFKSGYFLLTLYTLMAVTIICALLTRKMLIEVGVLVAWLVAPLLLINLHVLGISLDYQRIFFFISEPLVLLAVSPLQFFSNTSKRGESLTLTMLREWALRIFRPGLINNFRRLLQILLILGLAFASFSSVIYGYSTLKSVNEWYNFRDKYGDLEKLEALKWIKENTSTDAVFVAEEEIARWIEGYSSRRVLMYTHPMYLFVKGEQERAYVARTILLSSLCLTNGIVAMYEPYDSRANVSTRIALKSRGALEEVFFLESNSSYLEASLDGKVSREYLSNAKGVEVFEDKDEVRFSYVFENLTVDKVVLINSENNEASLIFRVNSYDPRIKLEKLVIELKEWPKRTIWEVKVKPNGTLLLTTDIGQFVVETNSVKAFPFIFEASQEAIIKISPLEQPQGGTEVKIVHSRELMKEFNARYVVIPRLQDSGFKRYITLKPITRPEYMHLLYDPSYRVVYQNDRVIILEFAG